MRLWSSATGRETKRHLASRVRLKIDQAPMLSPRIDGLAQRCSLAMVALPAQRQHQEKHVDKNRSKFAHLRSFAACRPSKPEIVVSGSGMAAIPANANGAVKSVCKSWSSAISTDKAVSPRRLIPCTPRGMHLPARASICQPRPLRIHHLLA